MKWSRWNRWNIWVRSVMWLAHDILSIWRKWVFFFFFMYVNKVRVEYLLRQTINLDFPLDELEPAAAIYLILHSTRCCCLTSWTWRDIIGSFISDALLPCKFRCSGPLLCMAPTLDIYTRLISQWLPASRTNLPFLLLNKLLAVGELRRIWKVFIWVWRKC